MPRQVFIGNDTHVDMACHVFALSGDPNPATVANINQRYEVLGDLLMPVGGHIVPADDNVANGLTHVTNRDIRNALAEMPGADYAHAALGLLCKEFGLAEHAGSGLRLWGHFEPGQLLPEHMYVTHTNGNIYDTMPEARIRRRVNNHGRNPPSYGDDSHGHDVLLRPEVCFSLEVAAFAAGTQAVINAPAGQWQNG